MGTSLQNLSDYDPESIPDASGMRVGIVIADWNKQITHRLLEGALNTLQLHGTPRGRTEVMHVPGSFELTYGARVLAEKGNLDAVICLGCVIRGETPHFDYVCQSVTQGITALNVTHEVPFIFGLLTTENMDQALERAGGKYGNKGDEAAITAIKMAYARRRKEDK